MKYTLYQPQVDKWDGYNFEAHAAVGVVPRAQGSDLRRRRDDRGHRCGQGLAHRALPRREDRQGDLSHGPRQERRLPAGACRPWRERPVDHVARPARDLARHQRRGEEGADGPGQERSAAIVFCQSAAVLVPIDGAPVWRPCRAPSSSASINTRAVRGCGTTASGSFYVHLFDGFLEAPAIAGPWTLATSVPPASPRPPAKLAARRRHRSHVGPARPKTRSRRRRSRTACPTVIVATTPTELIVTDGAPDWVPIENSMLALREEHDGQRLHVHRTIRRRTSSSPGAGSTPRTSPAPGSTSRGPTCRRTSPGFPTTAPRRT